MIVRSEDGYEWIAGADARRRLERQPEPLWQTFIVREVPRRTRQRRERGFADATAPAPAAGERICDPMSLSDPISCRCICHSDPRGFAGAPHKERPAPPAASEAECWCNQGSVAPGCPLADAKEEKK